MRQVTMLTAVVLAAAALGGCDRLQAGWEAASADAPKPAKAPRAAPARPPLVADGAPVMVQPTTDMGSQLAASVVRVDRLAKQGGGTVKLFGTAGGDPAMNGLVTEIAFFRSSAEGWAVFRVGDFLDYRVLSDAPGRVDLEIDESVMDEATTVIGKRTRRIIIAWTPGADGTPPAVVTVTPAK